MRVTIHFDFKPEVTIIGCEVTLVTFKKELSLSRLTRNIPLGAC